MSVKETPHQAQHRLSLIPELLEQIFLEVPAIRLISTFRQVCKTWKTIIEESASPQLQNYRRTGLQDLPKYAPPERKRRKRDYRDQPELFIIPLALDIMSVFWRKALLLAITVKPNFPTLATKFHKLLSQFEQILRCTNPFYPPRDRDNESMHYNWEYVGRYYSKEDINAYDDFFPTPWNADPLYSVAVQIIWRLYFDNPERVTRGYIESRTRDEIYEKVTLTGGPNPENSVKAFLFFVFKVWHAGKRVYPQVMFDCYEPYTVRVAEKGEVYFIRDDGYRLWWLSEYKDDCYLSSCSDIEY
ncbi:hypothetical protein TWF281_004564 [Arthrobotrys megalospora]